MIFSYPPIPDHANYQHLAAGLRRNRPCDSGTIMTSVQAFGTPSTGDEMCPHALEAQQRRRGHMARRRFIGNPVFAIIHVALAWQLHRMAHSVWGTLQKARFIHTVHMYL